MDVAEAYLDWQATWGKRYDSVWSFVQRYSQHELVAAVNILTHDEAEPSLAVGLFPYLDLTGFSLTELEHYAAFRSLRLLTAQAAAAIYPLHMIFNGRYPQLAAALHAYLPEGWDQVPELTTIHQHPDQLVWMLGSLSEDQVTSLMKRSLRITDRTVVQALLQRQRELPHVGLSLLARCQLYHCVPTWLAWNSTNALSILYFAEHHVTINRLYLDPLISLAYLLLPQQPTLTTDSKSCTGRYTDIVELEVLDELRIKVLRRLIQTGLPHLKALAEAVLEAIDHTNLRAAAYHVWTQTKPTDPLPPTLD